MILLSRDQFREAVFARDKHTCVACPNPAADAHHIIERRLWPDGGYYLDNGVSLCPDCHIKAEQTLPEWDCAYLRRYAGITSVVLPPHLYADEQYDKWGNVILATGRRLQGELFDDVSVQKILQPVLHLFDQRVKYPRTWHLPWSHPNSDDRTLSLETVNQWLGTDVVITEKMDGECTTMYHDYVHARSVDYSAHVSRNWLRNLHARVGPNIPPGMRVCGENLWAKHSIGYDALSSYFLVFSIWDGTRCLDWNETLEWVSLLDLHPVPVLYQGPWTNSLMLPAHIIRDTQQHEGYVVRPVREFTLRDFSSVVGKYVRPHHVQTHGHWMRSAFTQNGLAK
jgi:hypothetical protein